MNQKEETAKLLDDNLYQIKALIARKVEIWQDRVLFTPLWWLGVALTIIPWVLWILYHKKDSTNRLLYVGSLVALLSVCLDILGDQLGLWYYRFNVIPFLPTYFPWDVTLMPVTVIAILQIKPEASPYLKALIFAVLASYVAEPFFNWLLIYYPANWRYSYSLPLQFLLYLAAHGISKTGRFAHIR